eukprot:scaffold58943_cov31-Tisochrysis_lutea.AAC.4
MLERGERASDDEQVCFGTNVGAGTIESQLRSSAQRSAEGLAGAPYPLCDARAWSRDPPRLQAV